jgi:phenylacetate-CoA ligase
MALDTLTAAPGDAAAAHPNPHADSYERLCQRQLHDMRAGMPAAIARLNWSAEQLAAERTRRLRRLLQIAKDQSPWHRRRLAHIDAATFTEARLDEIPPMTKHDLVVHFDQLVTDRRLNLEMTEAHLAALRADAYLLERYHVNASGGSSGQRSVYVHDWDGWIDGFSGFARHVLRHMAATRDAASAPQPFVGAVVASYDPTHMSCAMPQTFNDPTMADWKRFPVTQPFAEIVGGLNRVQPHVLIGYASMLHQLARAAQVGALTIAPQLVVSTSEPLLPEMRKTLTAAWAGARLLNYWASTEAAPLAISCGVDDGMHLSDDIVIVEPVDAHGRRVPPGVRSAKVYMTNLHNPTPLPLIRYELSDQVMLLERPCRCGSAHRRIDDVHGRQEDMFVYAGAVCVHPVVFVTRIDKERHVVEYQVVQTANGAAVSLVCNGDIDLARLRDGLAADLRRLGVAGAEVTVEVIERIERQRSGKLKRFVSLSASAATARS